MNTLSIIAGVFIIALVGFIVYKLTKALIKMLTTNCVEIVENHSYKVGILTYATAGGALSRAKGYQNRLKIEPDIKMINCISGKETILTMAQLEMYALKEMKDEQNNPWQYYES